MFKKKKTRKLRVIYALPPVVLILILASLFYYFLVMPGMQKNDFMQIVFREWYIQNSLKEMFINDDFLAEMTQTTDVNMINEKFKEVRAKRSEAGKLFASELSILRKNCEELMLCRKNEFGLLAVNNLEGFADAVRNNDMNMAEVYDKNSADFLRLFKYDLLMMKGKLNNIDLSRVVALGNSDLNLIKKYMSEDAYCEQIDESLRADPFYISNCGSKRIYGELSEKTCYTEKNLSGEPDCKRSKAFFKQLFP